MFRVTAFAVLLTVSAGAWATQDQPGLALADGGFAEQRAQIEADLADGKTYSELSSGDRSTVRESLERIAQYLGGVDSVEQLTDDNKARVFNDQEVINNILTQAAADSRVVCTRETKTGSNRRVTTCQTVAERNRRRELDQENLRDVQRSTNGMRNN
ncbi:MAG TPA: hypothetical protein VLK29_12090 [Luteimonas sp.]|nr:hypothetical protein [Luteimonas sp.]